MAIAAIDATNSFFASGSPPALSTAAPAPRPITIASFENARVRSSSSAWSAASGVVAVVARPSPSTVLGRPRLPGSCCVGCSCTLSAGTRRRAWGPPASVTESRVSASRPS